MVPSPPSSPDGPGGLGSSFLAGARLVLRDLGRHVATDMPLASVHEESRRSAGAIAELPGACGSDWAKEWNSAHGTATLSGWKLALQSPFMLDEFSDDPVEQLRCSVVVGVRAREIRPVQIGRNPDRYVPRGVAPAMGEHIPRGPVALKQDPAGCVIAQMWRREIVEAVSDQNFWFGSRELARKEFGIVRIGQVHRSRGTQRSRIVTLAWPPGPVMSAAVPPGLIDRAPCAGPLQSRRSHPERNIDRRRRARSSVLPMVFRSFAPPLRLPPCRTGSNTGTSRGQPLDVSPCSSAGSSSAAARSFGSGRPTNRWHWEQDRLASGAGGPDSPTRSLG